MSKINYFKVFVFAFVLYFTFILRAHNYDRTPLPGHLDEMLYAWSGIYFIETGTPVSWSTLDYPARAKVFEGTISYKGGIPSAGVNLYKPWLDEPPLFSLLVGYFAHLFGADRNQFIPASFIRFPIVFISTLTSIFVFLIAKKLSGYWMGILSMFLYGTIPIFVFASRTALPENLISLFFTMSIYFLVRFKDNFNFLWILPAPFLAGIAGLSKPTGYFIFPFTLFFILKWLRKGKKLKLALRYCLTLLLIFTPFVVSFFIYGIKMDSEIFWKINSIQASRPAGFGSLIWYFISPSYDTAILKDSFFVFCLMSAVYFIFSLHDEKKRIILFGFVYWLVVVMISGGENDLLAWYRFPTYSTLSILGAWGIWGVVKKADFFAAVLAVGGFLGNRTLLVNAFRSNLPSNLFRLILVAILTPSILFEIFSYRNLKKLSRILIILIFIIGIYVNIVFIYQSFEIACEGAVCPLVDSTFLSSYKYPFFIRWFILDLPKIILYKVNYTF